MNDRQRYVLFVMAGIIALMLLFPPSHYDFIFSGRRIDGGILVIQWIGVFLVGGILLYALKGTKDNKKLISEEQKGFKDSTNLTQWVVRLLYGYIAINAIILFTNLLEFEFLFQRNHSSVANTEAWSNVFLTIFFIISIVSGVMILIWIYWANYNARQIGATEMVFTPGWSIGWYFIPIANLWKPYQAMKEIWKASSNPQSWLSQPTPELLPWWWLLWIGSYFWTWAWEVLTAMNTDYPAGVNLVMQISCVWDMALGFVLISVVKQIHKMQMSHAKVKHLIQVG